MIFMLAEDLVLDKDHGLLIFLKWVLCTVAVGKYFWVRGLMENTLMWNNISTGLIHNLSSSSNLCRPIYTEVNRLK